MEQAPPILLLLMPKEFCLFVFTLITNYKLNVYSTQTGNKLPRTNTTQPLSRRVIFSFSSSVCGVVLVDADAIFFRQSGGSPCVTHNPDDTNSTRRTSPLRLFSPNSVDTCVAFSNSRQYKE